MLSSSFIAFDAIKAEFIRDIDQVRWLLSMIVVCAAQSMSEPQKIDKNFVSLNIFILRAPIVKSMDNLYMKHDSIWDVNYIMKLNMMQISSCLFRLWRRLLLDMLVRRASLFAEGLIKNRYSGHTFIKPNQEEQELAVRMKLNAMPEVVGGKRIVLIDDSIVRGTWRPYR